MSIVKTKSYLMCYRQLLGHPAPRTRTQVVKLKLAVMVTPKKALSFKK